VPGSHAAKGTAGAAPPEPSSDSSTDSGSSALSARIRSLIRAIEENDETKVEEAILRLSSSRRVFAPLAFVISGFVMLWDGVRLLVANWRLSLVQILPAMWIWLAMFDLKAHTLHGQSFHVLRGPVLIPIGLVIVGLTVASFFLNAVFAFAIAKRGHVEIRPAVANARQNWPPILLYGIGLGLLLAFSTTVVTRWGRPWFGICLGIVVGAMMISYVAVPSRLIGAKKRPQSRRDRFSNSLVGGALSATVCAPPYLLGRAGILMLGSSVLLIPGILVFALGLTLQAGATGAVRAIKMSVTLTTPPAAAGASSAKPEQIAS
jgi:hypothetical protein